MWKLLKSILGIGAKALGNSLPDAEKVREAQARINEAEITGSPASRLRLWRSFLGWALTISFVWEAMLRPLIAAYWPDAVLPPSMIKETASLLLGMLGLGF